MVLLISATLRYLVRTGKKTSSQKLTFKNYINKPSVGAATSEK